MMAWQFLSCAQMEVLGIRSIVYCVLGHWVLGHYALDATSRATAVLPWMYHAHNEYGLSQECQNRASRPDSEHIITEQYPNCVNYMVTIPYIPYIVSGVGSILIWCHMAACSLYIKLCTLT